MLSGATSKHPIHSLIKSQTCVHAFQQINHSDGELGMETGIVTQWMSDWDMDIDDQDLYNSAKDAVREEYLAMQLLLKSDPRHYGALLALVQSNYITRQDKYPKTFARAYNMLVNYVPPAHSGSFDAQDFGLSFYQSTKSRGGDQGRDRGWGAGRASGWWKNRSYLG